jgi:uncharacterized protein (TIGR02646 family)
VIFVPFTEPADPVWVRWKARAENAQRAHAPGVEINDDVVRGVREWMLAAYGGKCAYCELSIVGAAARVDHFRPKRGIKRQDGTRVALRGRADPHPGYHWLAYDWRNLLPSCERCNGAKSNHFHTRNEFWAELSLEMNTEQPLLVHPSQEDPEGLLLFTRDGLVLPAAKGDARAAYIIETLDLNREELTEARAEAWLFAESEMDMLVTRVTQHDRPELYDLTVRSVETIIEGQAEFSAMKRLAIGPGQQELKRTLAELSRRERLAEQLTPRPPAPA